MSPCIENAIHLPSGLHVGSDGPVVTSGNRCRSTRSENPNREGPATSAAPATSVTIATQRDMRLLTPTFALVLAMVIVPVFGAVPGLKPQPTDSAIQANRALLLNPDSPEFITPAPGISHLALETSRGTVLIEVIRSWAPSGADRFYNLARLGYYDENRFFRVNPGRWTQFGIHGDPAIAKAWRTKTLADDAFKESNVRGTVAFAFAVPNGRTTQVFFNLGDNSATHDAPNKEPFVPFG